MREVGKSGHAATWARAYEVKYESKVGQLDTRFFDEMLGEYAVSSKTKSYPQVTLFTCG